MNNQDRINQDEEYRDDDYMQERLKKEINVILNQMEKNEPVTHVVAKKGNVLIKIEVENILYIERARRKTIIHCVGDKEYTSDKKLLEWMKKLSQAGFVSAHNSYIVNLKHVEIVGTAELQLDTGTILTVSRSCSKAFRTAFENI